MTIDEAIKALQQDLDDPGTVDYNWRAKAQELGIEALKAILLAREGNYAAFKLPLPGETKEVK